MIRAVAIAFLLLTAIPAVAEAASRNLLETGHIQRLLTRQGERMHERLLRRQALCDRRRSRREDRLRMRGGMGIASPASDADRSCGAIRDRLVTFATEEPPKPPAPAPSQSPSPSPSPSPPALLPNQTFVPTIPLPSLDASSRFLILGHRADVVATVKVTPGLEPVEVRSVRITLDAAVGSIASFEVLDDLGYVLGTAALDLASSADRNIYTLNLSPENAYFIGKDETAILAVRPRVKEKDAGGVSGLSVQVSAIDVTAIGQWTSRTASVVKSGPDFQKHRTALAAIVAIDRDGPATGTFRTGNETKIAAFTFEARMNDDGDPAVTDLTFSVSKPAEVALSNAVIRGNDSNDSHPCTVAAATIICNDIPSAIGSLQSPRPVAGQSSATGQSTISLFADVSLTSHPDPFLEITLNRPGRPDDAGDITWTDGETGFSWVPLAQPVALGTAWE